MIEWGSQVCFDQNGCYGEDYKNKCRLVAKGNKAGWMSRLDVLMREVNVATFAHAA